MGLDNITPASRNRSFKGEGRGPATKHIERREDPAEPLRQHALLHPQHVGLPDERNDGVVRQGLLLRHGQQCALARRGRDGKHIRLRVTYHHLSRGRDRNPSTTRSKEELGT